MAVLILAATPAVALANSFLVVAIDEKGHVGIGESPDPETAVNLAKSYCGAPGCYVISHSQANCVAVAQSFTNGYWFGVGTAPEVGAAIGYAVDFCSQNAPASSCQVAAKFCQ